MPSDKRTAFLDEDAWNEILRLNRPQKDCAPLDKIVIPEDLLGRVDEELIRMLLAEAGRIQMAVRQPTKTVDVLTLRLMADGRRNLLDRINRVGEFDIGDYRAIRLLDFGSQNFVFLGADRHNDSPVAIKFSFVDYADMSHVDLERLRCQRSRLIREAEVLRTLAGTSLPAFRAMVEGPNPLYPRSFPVQWRNSEQFLVMECIDGVRVDTFARALHRHNRTCCAVRLAIQFVLSFVRLAAETTRRLGADAMYTDIKPENTLLHDLALRVVDASSIGCRTGNDRVLASPLYLDPFDYDRWRGGALIPDSAFMFRTLRRCARLLVSNEPIVAGLPAPQWPAYANKLCVALDEVGQSDASIVDAIEMFDSLLESSSCRHGAGAVRAEPELLTSEQD